MKKTIIVTSRINHRGVVFEPGDEFDFTVFPNENIKILRNLLRARKVHFGVPVRTIDKVLEEQGFEFDSKKWLVIIPEVVAEVELDVESEETKTETNEEVTDETNTESAEDVSEDANTESTEEVSEDANTESTEEVSEEGEMNPDIPSEEELAKIEELKKNKNKNKR